WIPGIGIAAGAVFAAGIALRLGHQYDLEHQNVAAPSGSDTVISVRPLDAPAPEQPLASPPPPPPASATGTVRESLAAKPAPKVQAAATPEPLPRPEPAHAKAFAQETSAASETAAADKKESNAAGAARAFPGGTSPQPARRHGPEMDAVERKQAIAAGAWQNLHDRPEEAPATAADSAAPATTAAAPAMAAAPPPASAPVPPAAPPPPPPPFVERAPAPSAELAKQMKDEELRRDETPLPPDRWLAQIRTLLREQRRDDAMKSLAAFRKAYPKYRLPVDLRDLH
ncbi:MAG TPA: hypothetical protein VF132_08470, partial [Rudaea sp.]